MYDFNEIIQEGDYVIVCQGYNTYKCMQIENGKKFQNSHGQFFCDDIIGRPYGSRIVSRSSSKNEILILRWLPYLWTEVQDCRTQIQFQELVPGSIVVEAGTGSGSLTISQAHTIAPHGQVYTFEFNEERYIKAKEDFYNNKLDEQITIYHEDVCKNGFPFFSDGVDAFFQDLPTPWIVLSSCDKSLRPQGYICSFSPCIEQVQRVCDGFNELEYEDICTYEILNTKLQVYNTSTQQSLSTNTTNTSEQETKKSRNVDDTIDTENIWKPALLTKPDNTVRGHTGYLSFARKPSRQARQEWDTAEILNTMISPLDINNDDTHQIIEHDEV